MHWEVAASNLCMMCAIELLSCAFAFSKEGAKATCVDLLLGVLCIMEATDGSRPKQSSCVERSLLELRLDPLGLLLGTTPAQ